MFREVDLRAGQIENHQSKRRKEAVKKEISEIHGESHEIYGAPKVTEELRKKDM